VNYPDQLVSLFGAAFVVYCLQRDLAGVHLDVSQREVVSWTLGTEIADFVTNGKDSAPAGNRREGRTPHDTYPCIGPDTWIAVSCDSDAQREALAGCIASEALVDRDAAWWRSAQPLVDEELTAWTRKRTREEAVAALHAAGVPAVPVLDAVDRDRDPHFVERQVTLRHDGVPVKGLPMLIRGYDVAPKVAAPYLGAHTRAVLRELCELSEGTIDDLELRGVIYCGSQLDTPDEIELTDDFSIRQGAMRCP
jgi:crotonobetainyl-CoA:carnitine CoA-transferase CaiB-like acyl-CoA transferase